MEEKICQSCAMPLTDKALMGTNQDASTNEEYCIYCYKDGEYTQPEITKQEMVDVCVGYMQEQGMNETQARQRMNSVLTNLKRWKK